MNCQRLTIQRSGAVVIGLLLLTAKLMAAQNPGAGGLTGLKCFYVSINVADESKKLVDSVSVRTTTELGLRRAGISVVRTDPSREAESSACGTVDVYVLVMEIPSGGQTASVVARTLSVELAVSRWATLPGERSQRWLTAWSLGGMNWTKRSSASEPLKTMVSEETDRLANDLLSTRRSP